MDILVLVPDLRGNAFSFLPLSMMFAVGLSYMAFTMVYSCLLCHRLIDQSVWVYFWALCPVLLIYVSVSVPVPYCLDYCSFLV